MCDIRCGVYFILLCACVFYSASSYFAHFQTSTLNYNVFFLSLCFIRSSMFVCVSIVVSATWAELEGERTFLSSHRNLCIVLLFLSLSHTHFVFGPLCASCFFLVSGGNFHFKFVFSLSISTQIEVFAITETYTRSVLRCLVFWSPGVALGSVSVPLVDSTRVASECSVCAVVCLSGVRQCFAAELGLSSSESIQTLRSNSIKSPRSRRSEKKPTDQQNSWRSNEMCDFVLLNWIHSN